MKTIKVKSIIDGDTFISDDETHYRLISVVAPETNQPGFNKCRIALEKMILNKELEILREQPNLSLGRPVVEVRVIGEIESINKKMNVFLSNLFLNRK